MWSTLLPWKEPSVTIGRSLGEPHGQSGRCRDVIWDRFIISTFTCSELRKHEKSQNIQSPEQVEEGGSQTQKYECIILTLRNALNNVF
jgi:thymidylate kinase